MKRDSQAGALALPLAELGRGDLARVGGKNASLGEMIGRLAGAGIRVPGGFATTAHAYWRFLETNQLTERIAAKLASGRSSAVALLRTATGTGRRPISR